MSLKIVVTLPGTDSGTVRLIAQRLNYGTLGYLERKKLTLTISRLTATVWVYRTANLQMLHFIYLFNKYTY